MTDGIGRIFGGNSYGVGGYVPQRKEQAAEETPMQQTVNHEEIQVDPNKVMEFMASNNFFVAPAETTSAPAELEQRLRIMDNVLRYLCVKQEA